MVLINNNVINYGTEQLQFSANLQQVNKYLIN